MKITVEKPSEEFKAKLKAIHPELKCEVTECYEFDIPWYRLEYWQFRWWGFIMWLCETIVPELKKDPNFIRIGQKEIRPKARKIRQNTKL